MNAGKIIPDFIGRKMATNMKDVLDKMIRQYKLMEFLEIPVNKEGSINPEELYDIVMDEKRCQELITKLRNKAFW